MTPLLILVMYGVNFMEQVMLETRRIEAKYIPPLLNQDDFRNYSISSLPTEDDLPSSDGVPMETERHKKQMDMLINTLEPWLGERGYVSGDMFVYFSPNQVKNEDFKGPDVFVSLGVSNKERKSWVVWQEGKAPDIVIELLSKSTAKKDKGNKKQIYQDKLRVQEYYWFDPHNPSDWKGFELTNGVNKRVYKELPFENDCFISKSLGLKLILWYGIFHNVETNWLRWATLDDELILLPDEAAAQQVEIETQRAKAEAQRANVAEQRAVTAFNDGKQTERLETARKMLAKGYEITEVIELTGLSNDELTKLS